MEKEIQSEDVRTLGKNYFESPGLVLTWDPGVNSVDSMFYIQLSLLSSTSGVPEGPPVS